MPDKSNEILKLIHETKALSIWDRAKGPVFWYTAGVPGPFFVNTEWIIGKELANSLVDGITAIMESVNDPAARAQRVTKLIMTAYEENPMYREAMAAIIAKAKQELPGGSFSVVSGGERRDWIFSIPLAREMAMRHLFLFKDMSAYCEQPFERDEYVLHVSDLINNAASYFDKWLPALARAHLRCHMTVCVVSRNHGAAKLEEAGVEVVPLVRIDLSFFEKSLASGMIDKPTLDEIALHFRSPQAWAEKYLMHNPAVFSVQTTDAKSFERLKNFVAQDPWALRNTHTAFFDTMQAAINARLKSAAA